MNAAMWAGAGAIGGAAWAATYYATYAVRSQWLGPTTWHGRADRPLVALTFDDGPSDDTERVLDALAEHRASATFFLIGRHVERYPAIARRIAADGHAIGNHSYSHPIYLYRSPARTRRELQRAQQAIADATGVTPRWVRPPCGVRTPAYFAACRRLGLRTVQWSVAAADWLPTTSAAIVDRILAAADPGAIVLLHDGDGGGRANRRATADAVSPLVAALAAAGLSPAPLSHVIDARACDPSWSLHV